MSAASTAGSNYDFTIRVLQPTFTGSHRNSSASVTADDQGSISQVPPATESSSYRTRFANWLRVQLLQLGSVRSVKSQYVIECLYLGATLCESVLALVLFTHTQGQLSASTDLPSNAAFNQLWAFLLSIIISRPISLLILITRYRRSILYLNWERELVWIHLALRICQLVFVVVASESLPYVSTDWSAFGAPQLCLVLLWSLATSEWVLVSLPLLWLAVVMLLFPRSMRSSFPFPPFVPVEEAGVGHVDVRRLSDDAATHCQRLPREQLAALAPITTCHDREDIMHCAVCITDLAEGDTARILRCGHAYHVGCIDRWLVEYRRVCPLCLRVVCIR